MLPAGFFGGVKSEFRINFRAWRELGTRLWLRYFGLTISNRTIMTHSADEYNHHVVAHVTSSIFLGSVV